MINFTEFLIQEEMVVSVFFFFFFSLFYSLFGFGLGDCFCVSDAA